MAFLSFVDPTEQRPDSAAMTAITFNLAAAKTGTLDWDATQQLGVVMGRYAPLQHLSETYVETEALWQGGQTLKDLLLMCFVVVTMKIFPILSNKISVPIIALCQHF